LSPSPAIRGVLFDVDGTLLSGDDAIPGAAETLRAVDEAGLAWRLITNTTRRSCEAIAGVLRQAGFSVVAERILTPAVLARRQIIASGRTRALPLLPEEPRRDFEGVEWVRERPDWVVVGDLGPEFTWPLLNQAFRWLLEGAALLALQKNPYWHAGPGGLVLDAGAFVAGLEYAAGVKAEIVGKPNRAFFDLAFSVLELSAGEVVVVGDSLVNEGVAGAAAGCRTVLVRTGKFRDGDLPIDGYEPDGVLESVAELTEWLDRGRGSR